MVDSISSAVQTQYEAYPYPASVDKLSGEGGGDFADPSMFSVQFWPRGRPRKDLRILVAGCGTNQAARIAIRNRGCSILGIDLSETSVANELKLKQRHGLENLEIKQLNILDAASLQRQFDLIITTGVLHHMGDPLTGLRALAGMLADDGVLFGMLYSSSRRAGVYLLQDAFRRLGLGQNPADVKAARDILAGLPKTHYVHWYLAGTSPDTGDGEFVDTYLHAQDRAYSVPEVLALIRDSGLNFQCWQDNGTYYPDGYLQPGTALLKRIEALPDEQQWAVTDDLFLMNPKHSFIATRRAPFIPPMDSGLLDCVPHIHPLARIEAANDTVRLRRFAFDISLGGLGGLLLKSVDGERPIASIVTAATAQTRRAHDDVRQVALSFFGKMWRLGNIFLRSAAV